MQGKLLCIDPGNINDIIDDPQKPFTAGADQIQTLPAFILVQILTGVQQIGES